MTTGCETHGKMCYYCKLLTWTILALNTQLLEHVNGKGIKFLTDEIEDPVPTNLSDEDIGYTETYHYSPILNESTIQDGRFPKKYGIPAPHDNFVIYSPPIPSNNVPPVLNPVIPSYENEPQYLSGLMSDILKGNNVNYMTIGIFLVKIILFQKLLLLIAVYCIASLHWALKEQKDQKNKGRASSEEEYREFTGRFDVYNICSGKWLSE